MKKKARSANTGFQPENNSLFKRSCLQYFLVEITHRVMLEGNAQMPVSTSRAINSKLSLVNRLTVLRVSAARASPSD